MKVAQIANLLYRRLPAGRVSPAPNAREFPIAATTDYPPAFQLNGGAR
jgi:hypothetical protein